MTSAGRPRRAALLLAALAFVVYLTNLRPLGTGDTIPARLLPFSVLREGNLDLDEFHWLHPENARPYFLRRDAASHWRSKYPITTPLLVTPLAWPFVQWARTHGLDDDDARFRLLTAIFERVAAAVLASLSVALVFLSARHVAPPRWAAAATLVYAFGTTTWSTSSQALWQHGLVEVSIAGTSLCLLRSGGARNAFFAGIFGALGLAARPTTVIFATVVVLYCWRERKGELQYFLAPLAAGALMVLTYNISTLSHATGGYSGEGLRLPSVEPFLGLLISPSRGLFIYCPLAVLAFAALWRRAHLPLLRYLAWTVVAYVVFYSGFVIWWGGYSYGPRYLTDVMPLVALCAIPVARRTSATAAGRLLLLAGVLWCIGVQVIGVYFDDDGWNDWPVTIDSRTERLWAWSDPQIVRAAHAGWHGWDFAPLLRQLIVDPRPARLVPLGQPDLKGTIEAVAPTPWRFAARKGGEIDLQVTNRSVACVWPAFSDFGLLEVGLVLVWRSGDVVQNGVGGFVPLRRNLGPDDSAHVRTWVEAPAAPGIYDLEIDVVQNLGSSGRSGGASLTVPIAVE